MPAMISPVCALRAPRSPLELGHLSATRHSERRVVAYTPMQLFELVADVPRYPEFLPWCQAGRIRRRESDTVQIAELAIGFGPFHEKFASRVVLAPDSPDGRRRYGPRRRTRGDHG